MDPQRRPRIGKFSAEYEIVYDADVLTVDQDEASMDAEMYQALSEIYGPKFMGFIGGLHYQFNSERTVPADTVVVPNRNHDDPSALLIRK